MRRQTKATGGSDEEEVAVEERVVDERERRGRRSTRTAALQMVNAMASASCRFFFPTSQVQCGKRGWKMLRGLCDDKRPTEE